MLMMGTPNSPSTAGLRDTDTVLHLLAAERSRAGFRVLPASQNDRHAYVHSGTVDAADRHRAGRRGHDRIT
jgi:hypothetical protein